MKKLFSLALSLALCLGLTVPALAAGEEAGGSEEMNVAACQFDGVETASSLTLNGWSSIDHMLEVVDIDSCWTVKSGAPITVTNMNSEAGGRFYIFVESYTKRTESTVYPVSDRDGAEADMDFNGQYLSTGAAYLTGQSVAGREGQSIPTANGLFWHQGPNWAADDAIAFAKLLKPGESVTFTLPESGGDTIYRLYAQLYFPETADYYWETYDLKVSGSAAPSTPEKPVDSGTPAASAGFTDVPAGIWYAEPVAWAVEQEITTGTSASTFTPDRTCTVSEVIAFLWRAAGQPAPTIADPYTDGVSGQWYADAAIWAYEAGLISGKTFGGSDPCLRSMVVSYLWRLEGSPETGSAGFTDVPDGAWYAGAVAWAVEQRITTGTSAATFNPSGTCTRGEIVTFLYRALGQ